VKIEDDFDEKETLQTIIDEEVEKSLKKRRWRMKRFVSAERRAQQIYHSFSSHWWRQSVRHALRWWIWLRRCMKSLKHSTI
jgi:hypothetical protein